MYSWGMTTVEVNTESISTPLMRKREMEPVVTNSIYFFLITIMNHFFLQQWSKACALLCGVFFIICLFWVGLIADPALQKLHMDILRISLPGFTDMSPGSVIIGLIESVIFGLIYGSAVAASLNIFSRK
jgi:hypothetical protein